MRVSTLAWWPGKIPAGSVSSEIMATIDLLPTISKLAGQPVPTDRIIDGHDVSALLFGKPGAKSPHDGLYYEKDGIQQGKWKLVHYRIKANCFTELYDLNADLDEKNNLADKYPGRVKAMKAVLDAHVAKLKQNHPPRSLRGKPQAPADGCKRDTNIA
jgi:arylsulfatase A